MKKFLPFALVIFCAYSLEGRQEKRGCGTSGVRTREELRLHRGAAAGTGKQSRFLNATAARPDVGDIALLDDSDGVVARRNPFNLNSRTLRFLPAPGGYRYEVVAQTYEEAAAANGTPLDGLGDDDSREIALPFTFPFYGSQYRSVWINSDGNLTLGTSDANATDRSLGRLTSGPPRVAGLFRDLDPSRAGSIRTMADGSHFVVSFAAVPEYQESGTGALQTFQMKLFPDGRIEFAYQDVRTTEAVVGITPGGLQGTPSLVSFLEDGSQLYPSTVAERFTGTQQIDIFTAAQKFYQTHEDSYDYLVFYNTLGIAADTDVVAFEVTVRSKTKGNGDQPVDLGLEAGSKSRLQALLNMGPISQYPTDPNLSVPTRLGTGDTSLTVLAHEAGHLFLAFASVRDENNRRPMLGTADVHWAFTFNSEASVMEGNRIQDNGPGTSPRFLTTATVQGYAPLDQYLMGFRPPTDVPDTFYIANPRGSRISGPPRLGVGIDGDRRDVRISEIIQEEGRRTPDYTVAQRRFRFGFVLITAAGVDPTAQQLQQIDAYRLGLQTFFEKAASGNASADPTVRRAIHLNTFPAAGVVLGSQGAGTVSIEAAGATPTTILLRSQNGLVQPPASVTIPAGATVATFNFAGLRLGVDDLIAEAADARFERVTSRIQIAPAESLRVDVLSGDQQAAQAGVALANPILVRVTDVNELPYPGVAVQVAPTGGGSVTPATAVTGSDGTVSLRWTPGPGALNELRVTAPGGASTVVTALGRPAIAANGVVNAASFANGLVAGGIGTIFGTNLTGANIFLNGRSLQIFYVSTRQANFYVPADIPEGLSQLSIRTPVGTSDTITVPVTLTQPGIFYDAASGFGAVTVAGTGQVTQLRPAQPGDVLEIYATGLGALTNTNNGLQATVAQPAVLIGGAEAQVLFSGAAPGYTGLYQINARVPAGIPAGNPPVVVLLNGLRSNEVKVVVR